MNITDAKLVIKAAAAADDTVLMEGLHGIGKSEVVGAFATENNYYMVPLFLSHQEVGDLIGMPRTTEVDGEIVMYWTKPIWLQRMEAMAAKGIRSVLFLDELPEFKRGVLEVMRQPLEDREVTISRAKFTVTYPSSFMLVAAMNPCPCGYFSDPKHECRCTYPQIHRFRSKISGPLMDRIDIHVEVPAVPYKDLIGESDSESSEIIAARVTAARARQSERFKRTKIYCNAQMINRHIKKHCKIDEASCDLLESAIDKLGLSARAYNRILKIARTIADLDDVSDISVDHIAEAVQYRSLDRGKRLY